MSEGKKPEILHFSKFMDGRMTPSEAHATYAFRGRKCDGCHNKPGIMRIKVFMPMDELMRRAPNFLAVVAATNKDMPGQVPTVKLKESTGDQKGGDYFKASDTVWCHHCRTQARLEAAKGAPSWAVVEIDEGIKDKIQVGYRS